MIVQRAGAALIALVLGAALAGCATSAAGIPQAAPATAAPPPTAAPADAEAEIRAVFDRYTKSLLDRDFATACAIMTEDAAATNHVRHRAQRRTVRSDLRPGVRGDLQVPQAAAGLDEAGRGIRIESVEVAGDTATVTYSGAVAGNPVTGLKRR